VGTFERLPRAIMREKLSMLAVGGELQRLDLLAPPTT
jgi:hypothetical protein